jgi:hypothetical protein
MADNDRNYQPTAADLMGTEDQVSNVPDFRYRGQQMRRAQLAHVRIGQELRDCAAQGAIDIVVALLGGDDELTDLLNSAPADLDDLTPPEPPVTGGDETPAKRAAKPRK